MGISFESAVIELELLTAEYKAKKFATEEEKQQALKQLKESDCFKIVEQFVGNEL